MTLSIIIVNHNVRCFLEQCLLSVRRAAEGISHEVIVVDNASQDDSYSYLPDRFPEVRFFWNEGNPGFGRACNQGTTHSQGDYILFLNPDTIVPEGCLQRCLDHLAVHPSAGALGVRMHDGSGIYLRESKRSYPSPSTAFLKLSGLSTLFPESPWFARYDLGHLDGYTNCPADVLAGAFMMVRREALLVTGGFDERFFMYGEDIDLSWRLRLAGFENLYLGETAILHFKGESNRRDSLRHLRHFYGAMAVFVRKHHPGLASWLLFAIGLRAGLSVLRMVLLRVLGLLQPFLKRLSVNDQGGDSGEVFACATESHFSKLADASAINSLDRVRRLTWAEVLADASKSMDSRPSQGKELIASPPACSYGEIVDLLAASPGRYRIRLSAEGSGGLVGSALSKGL